MQGRHYSAELWTLQDFAWSSVAVVALLYIAGWTLTMVFYRAPQRHHSILMMTVIACNRSLDTCLNEILRNFWADSTLKSRFGDQGDLL